MNFMKKSLLMTLCTVLCILISFSSCKDDKEEVPPTVEDIVAEYSADNLVATIEGADVSAKDAKVEIAKGDAGDKVTIILNNVVPGTPVFKIPNAEFAVTTRAYVSTLKGELKDDVSGYDVKVDGTVDGKVLTVKIKLTEIEGENTNTSKLYNLVYKGNMDIDVANIPEPISMLQRVYVAKARTTGMAKRDTSMVKLTIKNFSFQGLALGDITLDTVLVQKRGEVLAFKADGRKLKFAALGEVGANLQGTIVNDKMNLNLDIDASGLKVAVAFNGQTTVESKVATISEMKIESADIVDVKSTTSSYTISVWSDIQNDKLKLTPKYKLADKAVIDSVVLFRKGQPSVRLTQAQIDGTAPIDFSVLTQGKDDYVKYFLAAEDPNTKGSFIIYVERLPILTTNYTFDKWVDGDPEGWATSNMAALFFPMFGINVPTPVAPTEDGKAAVITTSRTVSESNPNGLIPGVTAGTMFLGTFSVDISNTLKSTHFGLPFKSKPATLKVTYKYVPGTTYYKTITVDSNNDTEIVKDGKDECSISAYLYEVGSFAETLDGTNINTSNKVILKATVVDGATNGVYKDQTIQFSSTGNGTFDPAKKYKLAVVCSSSNKGDQFMGADGSQLFIKKLVIE